MASRYPSFDTRSSTSSQISDPSSSSEFRNPNKSSFKHTTMIGNSSSSSTDNSSRALIRRTKSSDLVPKATNKDQNLSSMVKKFMEKRSSSTKPKPGAAATPLFIPADFIAEDLKKTAAASSKASTFSSFHRKLFQNSSKPKKEVKALTEVKSNTRTLAMVLRSERELLNQNKDYEIQINELKLIMEDKNREVEKLKDLCLKQREEIKALKSAILFPDVMNTQLQGLLEKQGTELQQAKQVIPTLQRQVTSLTGQLQCLADDLAEVKADKYATRTCFEDLVNSPGTPIFDQEANSSLELSSGDGTNPGSPDDMFLKDFNPCLTPYSTAKSKSKEFGQVRMMHGSPEEAGGSFGSSNTKVWSENYWQAGKISKSSEYEQQRPSRGNTAGVGAFRWSNDNDNKKNNNKYGKPMQQKLF